VNIADPKFATVLADQDGHSRWIGHIDATDIMNAYRTGGIHLLVTLNPEGDITVAFKPGRHWQTTWSPPITLERK
jgi:hypothetical protein